jgi:adenylyl-sulfate kinase
MDDNIMSMLMPTNLTAVAHHVGHEERRRRFGHDGAVLWLTGLSASGKSTLAMGLEQRLLDLGYACYTLDGDNIRHGLNANLGFSPADRTENIRRVGEVAALFADAGMICITAFISPYRSDRARARAAASRTSFHEIHVAADIVTCEARDPKGLYRQARDAPSTGSTYWTPARCRAVPPSPAPRSCTTRWSTNCCA